MVSESKQENLDYHLAASPLGGSYAENKLRRLALPDLQGKRFLDLGCNSGFFCEQARLLGAAHVVGVDIDKGVIANARKTYPDVEFHDEGWSRLPSGEFDVVIILSAIHYASDPVGVVQAIWDQLATGGLLVIEGGILDPGGQWKTDCLIPGWRQVGDRCRHLSGGYIARHLLASFDWRVVGPSEPRGGDLVPRFVVHATKRTPASTRAPTQVVDLVEYTRGLTLSSETIVEAQPAYLYVKDLPNATTVDASQVEALLGDKDKRELFLDDLAFALEPSRSLPVRIVASIAPQHASAAVTGLRARGIQAIAI